MDNETAVTTPHNFSEEELFQQLLARLIQLRDDETLGGPGEADEYDHRKRKFIHDNQADYLANSVMIGKGMPPIDYMRRLESAGFPVLKGDGDSFGWLVGIIRIPRASGPVYISFG